MDFAGLGCGCGMGGVWWVWCLSGVLVWVSEWSYGFGRVVYVVWIRSDLVWRERGLACVVCWGMVGWVLRQGSGEEGVMVFFSCEVWCLKNRAVWWCGER